MKKIYNILLLAAVALGFASCADVPAPYDINAGASTSFGKKLPYKSASLNTGFTTYCLSEKEPWSQGSSYTQATGYQDWDGNGKKNAAVESYLISPALNTTCASGKVRFSFDLTLRYATNFSNDQIKENHKIFISKSYDGKNFDPSQWEQINYTPATSTYNDWTLYGSGYIAVPEEYVNHDSVYVAFYFKAPVDNSTTWELENFLIEEGEATGGDTPDTPGTDVTPQGDGTQASPYNVAGVVAYINTLDADKQSDKEVYVKGKVLSNTTTDATISSYGNMTFTMIDEGNEDVTFTAFQVYGPGKEKFTSVDQIKAGDEVVVCGKVVNYKGNTPETVGKGASYVVSINSNGSTGGDNTPTGEAKGDGSQASPFNVPGIIAYTSALAADANSANKVYFEGIVSRTKDISASYGNATFYISEDGSENNEFYVFRCLGIDGKAIASNDEVQVGDKVVIYGNVVNYKGNTPETVQKEAYIVKLERNGNTTGGDNGGDNGGNTGDAVAISGTTVTLTNSAATAGTDTETIDLSKQGWDNAAEVSTVNGTNCTVTFSCGENTKYPPKFYTATNGVRCYANNTITITGNTKAIAKVVMNCDEYNGVQYVGQATATVSFSGNSATYTNAGSGTTQLRVKTIEITYAK